MTPEETRIIMFLGDIYNEFCALPVRHPSDMPDFTNHIHALQRIIAAREGFRSMGELAYTAPPVPKFPLEPDYA